MVGALETAPGVALLHPRSQGYHACSPSLSFLLYTRGNFDPLWWEGRESKLFWDPQIEGSRERPRSVMHIHTQIYRRGDPSHALFDAFCFVVFFRIHLSSLSWQPSRPVLEWQLLTLSYSPHDGGLPTTPSGRLTTTVRLVFVVFVWVRRHRKTKPSFIWKHTQWKSLICCPWHGYAQLLGVSEFSLKNEQNQRCSYLQNLRKTQRWWAGCACVGGCAWTQGAPAEMGCNLHWHCMKQVRYCPAIQPWITELIRVQKNGRIENMMNARNLAPHIGLPCQTPCRQLPQVFVWPRCLGHRFSTESMVTVVCLL